MNNLKEGMILLQDTCDEIIGFGKNAIRVNPHTDHWLIQDITKDYYMLYNLDNQNKWKVEKQQMVIFLSYNKKFDIKPLFKISDEVA